MHIAFYAPMKAPTHPVPSGDRQMARALVRALKRAGHTVGLATRLRTWEGEGSARRQASLAAAGARTAAALVERYRQTDGPRRPDLWFTYHVYHKAPDHVGPPVTRALGIPYVIAEASIANKQAGGPWDAGLRAARECVALAHHLIALNPGDVECAAAAQPRPRRVTLLRPFLDVPPEKDTHRPGPEKDTHRPGAQRAPEKDTHRPGALPAGPDSPGRSALAAEHGLPVQAAWLACVAMMRRGAKLQSYGLLAEALGRLPAELSDWHLAVVGDGGARREVRAALDAHIPGRYQLLGRKDARAIRSLLPACDLFVWPAIDEAYGMALLEAQAAGVPAVAGFGAGVASIVRDGTSGLLVPAGDAEAFSAAVARLLRQPQRRGEMAAAAARIVRAEHGLDAAARALDGALSAACAFHAGRPGRSATCV